MSNDYISEQILTITTSVVKLTNEVSGLKRELRELKAGMADQITMLRQEIIQERISRLDTEEAEDPLLEEICLEPPLDTRSCNRLYRAGIRTLKDLSCVTADDILHLRNAGVETLDRVKKYAALKGISLAESSDGDKADIIPQIKRGDYVITLNDTSKARKGTIFEVDNISEPDFSKRSTTFLLPIYYCRSPRTGSTRNVGFSVSQIARV